MRKLWNNLFMNLMGGVSFTINRISSLLDNWITSDGDNIIDSDGNNIVFSDN